uniref:Adenylate kinase active site lid domain-containing protein n=1 Tax=Neobodo designis TaxID=312471 RepID=A0A6U4Y006_NEODS|mmetsp:Transcript_5650/g.17788  ORF Transcript_5650/g.17788 Transcript_5650/m.17788 type:complete len:215 (+) Transcript_5650:38-682(+)|eukprot:CAMPEP_0174827536 /NCGR_PEP_ID=MMETSP1114-20130205/781_1 /TAXON_ID=312471 /ORGANISM="Neobodo designis, Strain CCAP 1951/1" /LENGTH=214 /DNA_ID=CAMNT_0016061195 /DNA_START=40 /DNA_END=684 /DNA_ORIENTATION=-
MKIVVMGAPGCGKGTQCPAMVERYNVCHLSTGDMLRAAVAAETENGKRAKAAMDSGALVTDDIVFGIVKDAMQAPECKEGYIIDGLPRTLTQAKKMEQSGIAVDKVISFEVPDEVIIKRTSGRWIHRQSGRSYHTIYNPPKVAGKDDQTGEDLMQRADDKEEVVRKRLVTFHQEVGPIHEYYKSQGKLSVIDGHREMMAVRSTIFSLLDPLRGK